MIEDNQIMLENKIPLRVWNGIERGSYICIAQEIKPSESNLRRWVAIYANYKLKRDPLNIAHLFDFLKSTLDFKFCIVDFEVPVMTLKVSDGLSGNDLVNVSFLGVNSIDEDAVRFLDSNGVLLSLFLPEWKCDYPLR